MGGEHSYHRSTSLPHSSLVMSNQRSMSCNIIVFNNFHNNSGVFFPLLEGPEEMLTEILLFYKYFCSNKAAFVLMTDGTCVINYSYNWITTVIQMLLQVFWDSIEGSYNNWYWFLLCLTGIKVSSGFPWKTKMIPFRRLMGLKLWIWYLPFSVSMGEIPRNVFPMYTKTPPVASSVLCTYGSGKSLLWSCDLLSDLFQNDSLLEYQSKK